MLRLTMILLCFVLAAAAAGRYKAEAAVRETRSELRRLEAVKADELDRIQVLRAEVAYLESPERLAGVAQKATNLEPLSGAQLLSAHDFLVAFSATPDKGAPTPASERVEVAQIESPVLR